MVGYPIGGDNVSVTRGIVSRIDMLPYVTRTVDNVPNGVGGTVNGVCDPTGGFSFTPNTIANFGKVNLKRGRRIIEFALKYYF